MDIVNIVFNVLPTSIAVTRYSEMAAANVVCSWMTHVWIWIVVANLQQDITASTCIHVYTYTLYTRSTC